MLSRTLETLRPITSDELPVIFALNYAAMSCIAFRRFDDAEAIVEDAVAVYGRLPPVLICRYALRVAAGNLDAPGSLAELADVFTPAELALPFIRLVRLTLVVTGLSLLQGYERQVVAALVELRAIADDPGQEQAVRARATELLAKAAQPARSAA